MTTPVIKPYQICDDIISLLLEPHQNAGRVQSTAVGQNHSTFRHDEGFQGQKLQNNSGEGAEGNKLNKFKMLTCNKSRQ